jgi:hypothetical protein
MAEAREALPCQIAEPLDFFRGSSVRFNLLFVLIILVHDRRRVTYFHITEHPTARWAV